MGWGDPLGSESLGHGTTITAIGLLQSTQNVPMNDESSASMYEESSLRRRIRSSPPIAPP